MAVRDVKAAHDNNNLIGSMAHGYAQPAKRQNAYLSIVKKVFCGEITPEIAAMSLAAMANRSD